MWNRIKSILYNALWYLKGCPAPPPHEYKTKIIKRYGSDYALSNLIETGTFLGDTVRAQLRNYDYIASIELSHKLYIENVDRLKGVEKVRLYEGNSAELLKGMISDVPDKNRGVLFWLDGHYSGGVTAKGEKDTPIMNELDIIFRAGLERFVVLIDDAIDFKGKDGYPTLEGLKEYIATKERKCSVEIEKNIIRIVPIAM